ncbi:hypothetical protein SBFV3_gp16 [Sulfolobales Beppu filamentous virus 3]|uniref:Uncharacterized protein n=1 Tax=Sulfolobales Beppu filamentous virus 3 TaxID=2493124 RepID=A0A3S8NF46_9VIRU|nr:hypothetical protein HOU83_gp16 [Sulfolobales Beppu filamentous virus 3]AZI75851.1 hypothetical protein SBFV3_gp16 [Sulfolobales Beppu filamentous virus 3]
MYCVVYNPISLQTVLVDVDIPGVTTQYYAQQIAKRLSKELGHGSTYQCEVPIVGNSRDKNYAGFIRRMNKYVLTVLGNDEYSIFQYLGANAVVVPLQKLVITSLEDAIALLSSTT